MLAGFLQGSSCPCLPVFSYTWLELRCLGRMAHKNVHPTFLFLSLKTSWDDNLEQEERHLPTHPRVRQASARKTLSIFHYHSELPSGSFQPLLHSAPHLDSALPCLLGYCLSDTSARVQESVYTQGPATFLLLPEWRVWLGTLFRFLLIIFCLFYSYNQKIASIPYERSRWRLFRCHFLVLWGSPEVSLQLLLTGQVQIGARNPAFLGMMPNKAENLHRHLI